MSDAAAVALFVVPMCVGAFGIYCLFRWGKT